MENKNEPKKSDYGYIKNMPPDAELERAYEEAYSDWHAKNQPTIYRGFEIHPVFNFSNGKSDYEVFPIYGEQGWMEPNTTLEQVKNDIDEKLAEHE